MAKVVGGWVCMPKAEHNKLKNKCAAAVSGVKGKAKKRKAKKR